MEGGEGGLLPCPLDARDPRDAVLSVGICFDGGILLEALDFQEAGPRVVEAGERLELDAVVDELEPFEECPTSEWVEGILDFCDADDDDKVDLGGAMLFADHDEVLRNLLLKAAKTPMLLALVSWFARVAIAVL